jgi:hypothetical protein
MTFENDLARARADHEDDLNALTGMTDPELDYLARFGELDDPNTDGVECDHEEHDGARF